MKKTHALFWIILEILIGVLIASQFLVKALDEKNYLKAVTYAYVYSENADSTDADSTAESSADDLNTSAILSTGTEIETEAPVTITVTDLSGSPIGTKVAIVEAEESSVIEQDGYENSAYQAYDGDTDTSWQEGVDGAGEGEWVRYVFDDTHQITSIVFYLGVWRESDTKDYYHSNNRPKSIRISIGSDQSWVAEFSDEKVAHVVTFSSPVEASKIRFTILSVYEADNPDAAQNYDDTGIAEIMVMEM